MREDLSQRKVRLLQRPVPSLDSVLVHRLGAPLPLVADEHSEAAVALGASVVDRLLQATGCADMGAQTLLAVRSGGKNLLEIARMTFRLTHEHNHDNTLG